ncbi:MAG: hypothetical protein CME06_06360 [Gemmatimonadetes bacterium]|nr:hypothetical protein [Gemmatimonadota bacterium]
MHFRLALSATLLTGTVVAPASAARVELADDELRINIGATSLEQTRQIRRVLEGEFGARIVHRLDRLNATTVIIHRDDLDRLRDHVDIDRLAAYVERDGLASIPDDLVVHQAVEGSDRPGALATPNDPGYGSQWAMPCIDIERGWGRFGFAERNVTVAIIDTGTDLDHPDLASHINTADDYDFVNNDSSADDDNGHGTHTAGIAAAVTNNGVGVAGVLNAQILPIKVLDYWGTGWWSDVAAGIDHAVQKGADVISMSIGGGYDSTVKTACQNAYNAGLLVFGSSGNHGGTTKNYPAAFTSVIGVGSLRSCTQISGFSGRGFGDDTQEGNVEIVGGGESIYSTYRGGGYAWLSGTSMSCPQAAGVGLGYMAFAPGKSNVQMRHHIQDNADNLGSNSTFGYGRVDAYPFAD